MRYVKIPKPVVVEGARLPDGSEPKLSLLELVRDILGTAPEWRADDTSLRIYLEIVEALEELQPGDTWKAEDEQHEKLVQVTRALSIQNTKAAYPILRLFRAVSSAPKSLPKPDEAAEAKSANGTAKEVTP